ncbi:MAG TPA: signal peptidase I, partial [Hellea balneolensis]|nr:signal peptidase I [Hellea balneolensis]
MSSHIKTEKPVQETSEEPKKTLKEMVIEELKFILGLLAFLFIFFNFVFGHYKIPSESMQPTLEVGDHLYVNKFSYGFSRHSLILGLHKLPFLKDGRVFSKMPKRGDVIVFRNPNSKIIMIKRLIGLPGDKIQTIHGRLYINDQLIDRPEIDQFSYREHRGYVTHVTKFKEQLPG